MCGSYFLVLISVYPSFSIFLVDHALVEAQGESLQQCILTLVRPTVDNSKLSYGKTQLR